MSSLGLGGYESVYGTELRTCQGVTSAAAPGSGDAMKRCSFRFLDKGAHQVCVRSLPQNFSLDTGQGPWSDAFSGRPWCICVWAFASYASRMERILPLSCEATAAQVLDPSHVATAYRRCGPGGFPCSVKRASQAIELFCGECSQQAPSKLALRTLQQRCDKLREIVQDDRGWGPWWTSPFGLNWTQLIIWILLFSLPQLVSGIRNVFLPRATRVSALGPAPADAICRICHASSDGGPGSESLVSVCECRGSVGAVHLSCLESWRRTKASANIHRCELCQAAYHTKWSLLSKF